MDSDIKLSVISRKPSEFKRETKHDIHRIFRNYDKKLHPHALDREYQRALNATKLERVFAKPFIGNMSGHGDVVSNLLKHQKKVAIVASGSYDGQIKLWRLTDRKCYRTIQAHNSMIRAMCISRLNSDHFFSVDTQAIKKWSFSKAVNSYGQEYENSDDIPLDTIITKDLTIGMDHHYFEPRFITCGDKVYLWEEGRKEALMQWSWGADSTSYAKFNPVETDLFATVSSDRAITLFDMRKPAPLRKVILAMRSNQICWNPMEAFRFTVANEDHDLHSFDMRNLTQPVILHKDHTAAAITLDYSPTGLEIVSGSYDKTLRIFPVNSGHSREVYHTKRMQKVTDVVWTLDNRYIISASDEMDIRLWKAKASEKIAPMNSRELLAANTNDMLREKFKRYPEIRRIAKHRHLPKHVYHAKRETRIMLDSRRRKEANRIAHSRPGTVTKISEKKKKVVREEE